MAVHLDASVLFIFGTLTTFYSTFNTHISTLLSWTIYASTCILLTDDGWLLMKIPAQVWRESLSFTAVQTLSGKCVAFIQAETQSHGGIATQYQQNISGCRGGEGGRVWEMKIQGILLTMLKKKRKSKLKPRQRRSVSALQAL